MSPGATLGYHAGMNGPADLLTAAEIAAELKVPGAKEKQAIAALGLAPAARKGVCSSSARSDVPKIRKALK